MVVPVCSTTFQNYVERTLPRCCIWIFLSCELCNVGLPQLAEHISTVLSLFMDFQNRLVANALCKCKPCLTPSKSVLLQLDQTGQ